MADQGWQVVSNKKSNPKKVIPIQSKNHGYDPIISRERENKEKMEMAKKESMQIKYNNQKDPNADWIYTTISKTKPKPIIPSQTHTLASAIKETAEGDIKIKKVSSTMAKAILDARMAKQWTQIQLARNSTIDVKTISEIERGGGVYNANVFNKLCKTLGINVNRNFDIKEIK